MSGFSIYRIGRGADADIRIDDTSVSRLHAELIITAGGACHLTDCASSGGSYREKNGKWAPIKQEFIDLIDTLLLGRYQITTKQLLALAEQDGDNKAVAGTGGRRHPSAEQESLPVDDRPAGPVRRDAETGDIIGAGDS